MSKKEKYTNKRYLPIAMKYKFKQNLFINWWTKYELMLVEEA
jgi:hypothetical protein